MGKRAIIISFFLILFIAFVVIWNYSYQKSIESSYYTPPEETNTTLLPSEKGVFERSAQALQYFQMAVDENYQRSLSSYYDNRAYPGAPPSIPHPVDSDQTMGAGACLKCHQNGGFVHNLNAFAPVTPHPKMVNCRQCHVVQNENATTVVTNFNKIAPPAVGEGANNALPGSPPMIPHQLQMRENCLACHAGPAAPKEIRVTHPDRVNCRQCHLPKGNVTTGMEDYLKQFKPDEN